jgi:hypothetical protein
MTFAVVSFRLLAVFAFIDAFQELQASIVSQDPSARSCNYFLPATELLAVIPNLLDQENLRGTREEVTKNLESDFVIGVTKKNQVLGILRKKYGVEDGAISNYTSNIPLHVVSRSQSIEFYTRLIVRLYEYRSIRHFFIKSTVWTKFYFDDEGVLKWMDVYVQTGPEF